MWFILTGVAFGLGGGYGSRMTAGKPGSRPSPSSLIGAIEVELARLQSRVHEHELLTEQDFEHLKEDVEDLRKVSMTHVTIERYRPVERLVFGAVALVLVAVVTALVALVIQQPPI